ncbi:MAG: hypothetical protein KDA66_09105 [Planctomycetaceae bacterium]|nr:hypothetical protein [Planctomycetaceae bacterium]
MSDTPSPSTGDNSAFLVVSDMGGFISPYQPGRNLRAGGFIQFLNRSTVSSFPGAEIRIWRVYGLRKRIIWGRLEQEHVFLDFDGCGISPPRN